MSATRELFLTVTNFAGLRRNTEIFCHVVAHPVARTMHFVARDNRKDAFSLFAFGFAMYMAVSLLAFSKAEGGEQHPLAELVLPVIGPIISMAMIAVYLWVTFAVFSRLSGAKRTLDQFVVLSATMAGAYSVLAAGVFVVSLLTVAGAFLGLGLSIAALVVSMRLYKAFWDLPYWKIIAGSLGVAVALGLVLAAIDGIASAAFG